MRKLFAIAVVVLALFNALGQLGLNVTYPSGGTITNGNSVEIKWTPPQGLSRVRIVLMRDEYHGMILADGIENTGSYTWTVNTEGWLLKDYNRYFIEVSGLSSDLWSSYEGAGEYFTIVPPTPRPANTYISQKLADDGQYIYFGVAAEADPQFSHYLEFSSDMKSWTRIEDSKQSVNADGYVAWLVQAVDPKLFFRVATPY